MFFKIYKIKSCQYLFKLILEKTYYMLQETLITFQFLTLDITSSKTLFFPSTIIEWNNLDFTFWDSGIQQAFIRPFRKSGFNRDNLKSVRLITRLGIGLSHLGEYKFMRTFKNYLNPICSYGLDIESTSHFLLYCPIINDER